MGPMLLVHIHMCPSGHVLKPLGHDHVRTVMGSGWSDHLCVCVGVCKCVSVYLILLEAIALGILHLCAVCVYMCVCVNMCLHVYVCVYMCVHVWCTCV